jgi:hypothetical protein
MKLEDLNVVPHFRGFRHEQLFDNGWGVSIIPEEDGEHYELAVLAHEERKKKHLSYTSSITNDVIRWCTVDAIDTLTDRVKNLPQRQTPFQRSTGTPYQQDYE